ncbi:MAG: hypothetical protein SFV54_28785 [Bryobacteraceae bacterium]|nr:hypothetical protein [Bryobacteraceae bacterium]
MSGWARTLLVWGVAAGGWAAAAAPDATQLLSQSIAADEENRKKSVYWLYHEAIVARLLEKDRVRQQSETTYEVLFLEGQPYFRLTTRNGQPLSKAEEDAEEARMQRVAAERRAAPNHIVVSERPRLAILYRVVPETHHVTLAGSEVIDGRDTWRIVAKPKRALAVREARVMETRAVELTIWLDKQSLMRVKQEAVATRNAGRFRKGDRVTHWFQPHPEAGGAKPTWLVSRITFRRPLGKDDVSEVDQLYSNYRRFVADSRISPDTQD